MRYLLIILSILFVTLTSANADVSVGIGISAPGVRVGINLPAYPRLVRIPGYPVFYDPNVSGNYFFYDGLYWVFYDDNWYASSWYNGPWELVDNFDVPVFILRIPVRYYHRPPAYFHGWRADAPPRWGEHWGHDWEQRRNGWDHWDRKSAPSPAPLPRYQQNYKGEHYPKAVEQQRSIQTQHYRYQPSEPVAKQIYQRDRDQRGPRQGDERGNRREDRGRQDR